MSTADIANLFSAAGRRERVVDWQAPGAVAKAAAGMSGLEAMCAIRDGILPPPPMARLIGFRLRIAEPRRIVMELEPHESLENTIGLLHGATAAALLDTAMGCAISTMLPAGQGSVTLDLKLTYLRRSRCDRARSRRKENSSSSAARPAMPKASCATGQAILRCTQPRRSQ
jgi:uncharacterized protein (TIGR00369 family)